jgi:hypothetical protein
MNKIMNKFILITLALILSMNSYSQKKNIPFFGKVKMIELCGSSDCRPGINIKAYVHKNDKLYYNGDYNSILGKVFTSSIFDTEASGITNITRNDVDYFVEHNGSGSIDKRSKTEFDTNVTANLRQLIGSAINLPEDLKVQLIAQIDNTVTNKTKTDIEFSFKIIQLKSVGNIGAQLADAFSEMESGEKIITGISVVTISGRWTSNTLREVLNSFEVGVGLNESLTGEAKLEYEESKNRALEGEVKEFSFIIGDSYKKK